MVAQQEIQNLPDQSPSCLIVEGIKQRLSIEGSSYFNQVLENDLSSFLHNIEDILQSSESLSLKNQSEVEKFVEEIVSVFTRLQIYSDTFKVNTRKNGREDAETKALFGIRLFGRFGFGKSKINEFRETDIENIYTKLGSIFYPGKELVAVANSYRIYDLINLGYAIIVASEVNKLINNIYQSNLDEDKKSDSQAYSMALQFIKDQTNLYQELKKKISIRV